MFEKEQNTHLPQITLGKWVTIERNKLFIDLEKQLGFLLFFCVQQCIRLNVLCPFF